jgi:hypothetical protein
MGRARHKKASGGRVYYSGGSSNVAAEAAEKKHGGKVVGKAPGGKPKHRMDKRARGGRVGSDKNPFSSAGGPGAGSKVSGAAGGG